MQQAEHLSGALLAFLLRFLPLDALGGVLKDDSHGFKLVADAVGLRPVAILSRLLTRRNHGLNLVVKALFFAVIQNSQNPCQLVKELRRRFKGSLAVGRSRSEERR